MSGISVPLKNITVIASTNGASTADVVGSVIALPRNTTGNIQRYLMAFLTSGTAPTARLEGSHDGISFQTISSTITASSSPTTAGATLVTVACPFIRGRLIAPATDTVAATLVLC